MKTFLRRTLNLQCANKVVPINPLGPIVHGLYFSSDNVLSIRCYTNELCARVRYLGWCMGAPIPCLQFVSTAF